MHFWLFDLAGRNPISTMIILEASDKTTDGSKTHCLRALSRRCGGLFIKYILTLIKN